MDIVFLGEAVAQSIANAIKSLANGKVDKASGKGLSTNDYTTAEKNKLAGISEGANKTIVDTALSATSTNPVQNKVVNTALSGKLGTSGDSKDNTVTFTSSDTTDANATSWTSVSQLTSGITHENFLARTSQMFKNVRYLYKLLGTTDISGIGNGSVTGVLSALYKSSIRATTTDVPLFTSGDDLNNYRIPGVYRSSSSALSQTLLNTPITGVAFVLVVQDVGYGFASVTANFCTQIAYSVIGVYFRRYGTDINKWSDWKMVVSSSSSVADIDSLNKNSIINSGTVIPDGSDFNSYKTPGVYYNSNIKTCVNTPIGDDDLAAACELYVIPRGTTAVRVFQVALVYIGNTGAAQIWIRVMTGDTTFGLWYEATEAYSSTTVTGTYTNTWPIYKNGKNVFLQIGNILKDIPYGTTTMSGLIPQGYRPRFTVSDTLVTRGAVDNCFAIAINSSGDVTIYNYTSVAFTNDRPVNRSLSWITT